MNNANSPHEKSTRLQQQISTAANLQATPILDGITTRRSLKDLFPDITVTQIETVIGNVMNETTFAYVSTRCQLELSSRLKVLLALETIIEHLVKVSEKVVKLVYREPPTAVVLEPTGNPSLHLLTLKRVSSHSSGTCRTCLCSRNSQNLQKC